MRIHCIKSYIQSKEELINIENSKKSSKSSTKQCNSKKNFAYHKMFCEMFFFLHKFMSRKFFILPEVFYTKDLNTAHTPTKMKQNLLH